MTCSASIDVYENTAADLENLGEDVSLDRSSTDTMYRNRRTKRESPVEVGSDTVEATNRRNTDGSTAHVYFMATFLTSVGDGLSLRTNLIF